MVVGIRVEELIEELFPAHPAAGKFLVPYPPCIGRVYRNTAGPGPPPTFGGMGIPPGPMPGMPPGLPPPEPASGGMGGGEGGPMPGMPPGLPPPEPASGGMVGDRACRIRRHGNGSRLGSWGRPSVDSEGGIPPGPA